MPSQPRRQHVVPAFYLAMFTDTECADTGRLWVTDRSQRRQWQSTPRNTACHRDFYTGEFTIGGDPYLVERVFSHLESKWAAVIRDVVSQSCLPKTADDFEELMVFVAFQATRTPHARIQVSEQLNRSSRAELISRLQDKNEWQQFERHMGLTGQSVRFSRLELLAFAESNEYSISADTEWTIGTQLRRAIHLLPQLVQKQWLLCESPALSHEFICSDSPVGECVLANTSCCAPEVGVVTIPIGRRHLLVGHSEESLTFDLTEDYIATFNAGTLRNGNQGYSGSSTFRYKRDDGHIGSEQDFLH